MSTLFCGGFRTKRAVLFVQGSDMAADLKREQPIIASDHCAAEKSTETQNAPPQLFEYKIQEKYISRLPRSVAVDQS